MNDLNIISSLKDDMVEADLVVEEGKLLMLYSNDREYIVNIVVFDVTDWTS